MSVRDSSILFGAAASYLPPLNQDDLQSEGESNSSSSSSEEEEDQEHNNSSDEEEHFDEGQYGGGHTANKDATLLPERHWVRRRLEEIGEDKEYLQLARDWQRHRSNYEADLTKLKPLTKFKEETVWPFANSRLRFLTELVVQAYIKDALEAIGLNHSYPARRPPGAHGLPKSVLEGRCGLCWHTFHTLVSRSDGDTRRTARLELKFIRGGNAIRNTKEGKPNLAGRYNNSAAKVSWVNKLMELFYIANDDILGAKKEDRVRVWEQCNFRQKTRRLI
jgi:hypothetical protein